MTETLGIYYQTKDETIKLYCEDCKPAGTSHHGTLVISGYDHFCAGCGKDFKETTMNDKQVTAFMHSIVDQHFSCGAVMCTELAEEAAVHFDIQVADTDLFDHFCELALEVAQETEAAQAYQGY